MGDAAGQPAGLPDRCTSPVQDAEDVRRGDRHGILIKHAVPETAEMVLIEHRSDVIPGDGRYPAPEPLAGGAPAIDWLDADPNLCQGFRRRMAPRSGKLPRARGGVDQAVVRIECSSPFSSPFEASLLLVNCAAAGQKSVITVPLFFPQLRSRGSEKR